MAVLSTYDDLVEPKATKEGTAEMIILEHRLSALEVLLSQAMAMLVDMKGTVECRVPRRQTKASFSPIPHQNQVIDHFPPFVPQHGTTTGKTTVGPPPDFDTLYKQAMQQANSQMGGQSWFSSVFGGQNESTTAKTDTNE